MPTHLPLRDSGTMTTSITPCPGHRCFDEYTSRQQGSSRPTPLASAILKRLTRTCDDGQHQKSGAYHFDSRSSTHLRSPRTNARQLTRSKPYNTNHCDEEGPTWPLASTQAVHNSGVVFARTIYAKNGLHNAVYKLQKMFATTCDVHKLP